MIFRGVRMEHHISDINIKSFRGIKNLELKMLIRLIFLQAITIMEKPVYLRLSKAIRILRIFVSGVRCSEEMDREECHLI